MSVGDIISNRRKELGLTLEEIGNYVGVGKSTVQKWESGYISNMKRDKIALLAKVLQINPAVLINDDTTMENDNEIYNNINSGVTMYERFVELLQEKGITSYRVSKETGVTQTTLSDWKTGRATPKTATLQKIADYFNVSLDWLVGKSDVRQNSNELNDIYFSFAKQAQDDGILPEDIELAIKMIKELKNKNKKKEV